MPKAGWQEQVQLQPPSRISTQPHPPCKLSSQLGRPVAGRWPPAQIRPGCLLTLIGLPVRFQIGHLPMAGSLGSLEAMQKGMAALIWKCRRRLGDASIESSKCQITAVQQMPNRIRMRIWQQQPIEAMNKPCMIAATSAVRGPNKTLVLSRQLQAPQICPAGL